MPKGIRNNYQPSAADNRFNQRFQGLRGTREQKATQAQVSARKLSADSEKYCFANPNAGFPYSVDTKWGKDTLKKIQTGLEGMTPTPAVPVACDILHLKERIERFPGLFEHGTFLNGYENAPTTGDFVSNAKHEIQKVVDQNNNLVGTSILMLIGSVLVLGAAGYGCYRGVVACRDPDSTVRRAMKDRCCTAKPEASGHTAVPTSAAADADVDGIDLT